MQDHLRYSGLPDAQQREVLAAMVRDEPVLMEVLKGIRAEVLPEGMLVAGALYHMAWNRLAGRPGLVTVNDLDVFFFDDADLSYEAEDVAIQRLAARFAHLPIPVQVRNQARVHLWFEGKFGAPFTPLQSAEEMLGRYAARAYAVGARLEPDDQITIMAPFGLDDLFSFRVVPNHALENRPLHEKKGVQLKATWPQLRVEPW
ncbi:nucleotidyltransferase family protein [Devosia sp.]|uniref:nucleotidyltransferase family protein n=1 Tax=Devosia sp. TaxID=1871048 RepID=UPI003BA870A8